MLSRHVCGRVLLTTVLVGATLVATVAAPAAATKPKRDVTITLVTHDSFAVSRSVLAAFTRATGITVKVLPTGDAGVALNQAILTKDDPIGDVLFGVDNTFLSRALEAGIFERYTSPELTHVPSTYRLDPTGHAAPIDHGSVCINYDKHWFDQHHLDPPGTLEDLTKAAYRGTLVVENPATSSPGLAFLLATINRFGDGGWLQYWESLRANDVEVVNGWEQAYNGDFSAGEGDGDRPLVVSYASSPAAAVYFSDPRPSTSPIGTVLDTCFDQTEFAGVLHGTRHPKAARRLVDFMLSRQFQEDVPLQMFVFPVRDDAKLPPVFEKFAEVPTDPASIPPSLIGTQREAWINQWTDTVLR